MFEAALFCGDFNSDSFLYLNVIILLINSLLVCGTFHLQICGVIKLGHRITYGNREAGNTTKQPFRTTWTCYNIELTDFDSVSSHITYHKYIIYSRSFLLSYINSYFFSSLHDEHFEKDEKKFLQNWWIVYSIIRFIN